MTKIIDELSVFFPLYNEEKNVRRTVRVASEVLKKVAKNWEIILVNDGSSDDTLRISKSLAKDKKNIRVVNHKVNRGYGGALKSGYKTAKYDWVAFSDADGQFDFNEIVKFIDKQKETGSDLVLGIRKERADSIMRRFATMVWSHVLPKLIFGLKVTDYSCGFKLVRKEVFDSVQPLVGEEKVTQIEMLVKAQRSGYKFAEVNVSHYPREFGQQTGANLRVVFKSIIDLLKLWQKLR
jgi:glycosyltransferase involved in cell wall biosynthesis